MKLVLEKAGNGEKKFLHSNTIITAIDVQGKAKGHGT